MSAKSRRSEECEIGVARVESSTHDAVHTTVTRSIRNMTSRDVCRAAGAASETLTAHHITRIHVDAKRWYLKNDHDDGQRHEQTNNQAALQNEDDQRHHSCTTPDDPCKVLPRVDVLRVQRKAVPGRMFREADHQASAT